MLDEDDKKICMYKLEDLRKKGNHLTRWAVYDIKEKTIVKESYGSICVAPMRGLPQWGQEDYAILHVFNGESHPNNNAPRGMLKGGGLSQEWLKFILDTEISPYRSVLSAVENIEDVDWINEKGGTILTNYTKLPGGAMLGFMINHRFAQEANEYCLTWIKLVDAGIEPRMAYILATSFKFTRAGKNMVVTGGSLYPPSHGGLLAAPVLWAKNWYNGEYPYDQIIGEVTDKTRYNDIDKPRNSAYEKYTRVGLSGFEAALGVRFHPDCNTVGDGYYGKNRWFGYFGIKEGDSLTTCVEKVTTELNRELPIKTRKDYFPDE